MPDTTPHSASLPSPRGLRGGQPEQYALIGAIGLALAIAGFDLITESAVGIGFLGLVPLLAATRGASPRQVAAMALLVTVLVIALGVPDDIFGEPLHLALVASMVAFGLLSVHVARLRADRDLEQLRLEVQYEVAAVLQASDTLVEAAPRLLEAIGIPLGWQLGGLWEGRPPRVLRCVESWSAEGVDPAGFDELSRKFVMRPGVGLPGRVWEEGRPVWVPDMASEPDLPRSEAAAAAGIKGAVGFPLRTSTGIVGVLEFFAREVRDPDPGLEHLLEALGSQVGEFVESQLGEEALRRSEALKSAVLESALDCVITIDHEGRVLDFNPAAEATFGISEQQAVGREMAQLIIPPDLREAHRAGLARYLEGADSAIVGHRVELRGVRADGTEFPLELSVTRIGDGPRPVFTGYLRDITRRQRADEERERLLELERVARADADRAMEQLSAILRGVADGVTAQAPDGSLVFANQRAIEALGYESVEELTRTPTDEVRDRFEMYDEEGEPFPPERLPGRLALAGEEDAEAVIRSVDTRDGGERWNRVKATPIRAEDGAVVMAINVMEDVTDLKRAEQSQRLLAEAGRVIGSSMDSARILGRIARLSVVPWLADWCSIHTLEEDESLKLAAYAASNEEKAEVLLELQRRFPAPPDADRGIPNVVRTLQSEIYPEITPEMIESQARSAEHVELVRQAGPHSALVVPITARGRALGAIALLRLGEGRRYGEEDLEMAQELGRRVGVAVDNARLYAERSYIAQTLQQSLLPAELPQIPGLETGARFRATGEGNDVGGDFYDLFEAAGGGWSVVVGDVCGKGPDAAAVTALARYTLRAAAMRDPGPSAGLRTLNEALLRQRNDLRFATVAYASVVPEPEGARVALASAGHPLPLLLRGDGAVEAVGRPGTLVGVVPDPDLGDASAYLRDGDALVFYTDGVTEARGGDDNGILGEGRLSEILAGCAGMSADAIAAEVERAAVERQEGETRDDIAVVVLRSVGDGSHNLADSAKTGRTQEVLVSGPEVLDQSEGAAAIEHSSLKSASSDAGFRMRIGGGPRAAGRARTELSRLRADLDPPLLETVRLLVTELVTNSVRHAGAAAVELAVLVGSERVRVEIANPGAAFEPQRRDADPVSEGGWGLFLVDRLSDDWGVAADDAGHQRVWFDIRRG